ncbi:hypothetical protein QFC20_003029 [Naganishia adeliensis]|uniref:Uncharacterized protein n=1 Tax=Naganishia adeliensis TaxID=92952 RepID=A0ACC2WHZ1_9TREE|nr:hypothetical protein QFC20_003029 [Naganishia adeliensis]
MDSNGNITMSEAGPSKRAGETDSTSNHDSSKPPLFVLPPDPSEAKAKNAKFSYVTAESRLPPRNPESFSPSRKTGVVYDAQMMLHAPMNYNPELDWEEMSDADDDKYYLAWHPEDPRRIQKIYDQLQEQGLTKQMLQLPCPTVSVSDVLLVHSEALYNKVEKTQYETRADILKQTELYEYNSLYVNQHTARSASLSCGGVVCAAKAVVMGKVKNAMAIVTASGTSRRAGMLHGFLVLQQRRCCGSSSAERAWSEEDTRVGLKAFFDDPSVLYMSIHRHDGGSFYPQSDFGALEVTGSGRGEGTSVNIPWPKRGFGDADYLYAFQKIIMPIAYEFAPELVIISAGFDAADGDTLGQCKVTPTGYAHMTYMLSGLANGKVLVALEGGYNLKAISNSAEAVARILLGEPVPELPPLQASDIATELMYQVAKIQCKYWKSIDVQSCLPIDEITANPDEYKVTFIPDMIKVHRAHHLYNKYGMTCLPLALKELQTKFPEQVMNTGNTYSAKTLVLFVHDLYVAGMSSAPSCASTDRRLQFLSVETCLRKAKRDYTTTQTWRRQRSVVDWVKSKGYSLIDVNVLRALPTHRTELEYRFNNKTNQEEYAPILGYTGKTHPDGLVAETQLLKYIWDNYIQLTEADNVIFIGHGTGCQALMCLINERAVEDQVKMVVQVAGMNTLVRPDPRHDERIMWYRQNSLLYLPQDHPLMDEKGMDKRLKTQVVTFPNTKPTDIMNKAFPAFTKAISLALKEPVPEEPATNAAATSSNGGVSGAIAAVTKGISAIASAVQSSLPGGRQ